MADKPRLPALALPTARTYPAMDLDQHPSAIALPQHHQHQQYMSVLSQNPLSLRPPRFEMAPSRPFGAQKINISNLMSPPDVPMDTFAQPPSAPHTTMGPPIAKPSTQAPLSPPASPYKFAGSSVGSAPTLNVGAVEDHILNQDPILYPNHADNATTPPGRLFPPFPDPAENPSETAQLVEKHVRTRPKNMWKKTQPPSTGEYELVLYFRSIVWKTFQEDPLGWLRQEKALLRIDHEAKKGPVRIAPAPTPAAKMAAPKSRSTSSGSPRARPASGSVHKPTAKRSLGRTARTSPLPGLMDSLVAAAEPPPRARVVAPNRVDKDFDALRNICPPIDSLDKNGKAHLLKVDWKANRLDLSQDPHQNLLHPAELELAAGLRLDCATYLTSKRRIFLRRLECADSLDAKEFRKTDAQQACKIDVNKASKLWTAYEKVGWLELHWMRPYMTNNVRSA